MKIYVGHSTAFDYVKNLYLPLKSSSLWQQHIFILPHDSQLEPIDTKEIIATVDLVIAEVSMPSTRLGIELGWANHANRKILCLYLQNTKPSSSLYMICNQFIEYSNSNHLITELMQFFR